MNHFLVFGSHPRLSLAEFAMRKPGLTPAPILCAGTALVDVEAWDDAELMNTLGGTVKLGNIVGSLSSAELSEEKVADLLRDLLPNRSFDFGWTVYGAKKATKERLSKVAMKFKKLLKQEGHSTRWVTSKDSDDLSPAAVEKLKLTTEGLDICLFVDGETTYVGLSTQVQDATNWSDRDYGRPARDDRNGMLPPKLARMMVNLAQVPDGATVLDPFCGSGTVLMETALVTKASRIIGSDIEKRQVEDTQKNTDWLVAHNFLAPEDQARFQYAVCDARHIAREIPSNSVDRIVTEGFLGPPLNGRETQERLDANAELIADLWEKSLVAIRPTLKPHAQLVCIWPAFKTERGMARVDLTDRLAHLGYRLVHPLKTWEGTESPLIYSRPEQFVQRRIVILACT